MIVVIGAGMAGLVVARALVGDGAVTVVEATDHVGGRLASHLVSGARVDLVHRGLPEELSDAGRTALADVADLGPRPGRELVRIAGRWARMPAPAGVPRRLPCGLAARVALERAVCSVRAPRTDDHAGVTAHQVGATLWRHLYGPAAWKRWGTDPRHLAGDVAPAVVRRRNELHPSGGFGAMVESMAATLPTVRLGAKVTALYEHDDRAIVGLADGRILTATHVVSTVPVTQTARWLRPDDVGTGPVRVRAAVLVFFTVDRLPDGTADVHHLPERRVLPARLSRVDHHDRTVLCAEIPCWADDAVWRTPDRDLALRVRDDLVRCDLPDPRPLAVDVRRLPFVEPVPTPAGIDAIRRAGDVVGASRRVTALDVDDLDGTACPGGAVDRALAVARDLRADA